MSFIRFPTSAANILKKPSPSFLMFQKLDRKTMRALQTGNYLDFKEDFERALSTVNTDKRRDVRLNVDITTPDGLRSKGKFVIVILES